MGFVESPISELAGWGPLTRRPPEAPAWQAHLPNILFLMRRSADRYGWCRELKFQVTVISLAVVSPTSTPPRPCQPGRLSLLSQLIRTDLVLGRRDTQLWKQQSQSAALGASIRKNSVLCSHVPPLLSHRCHTTALLPPDVCGLSPHQAILCDTS